MLLLFVILLVLNCCRSEPGRICDPDFYNQTIRPATDALEVLYRVFGTKAQTQAESDFAAAEKILDEKLLTLIRVPIDILDEEEFIKQEKARTAQNKGCSGLLLPYLTCDTTSRKCVCKSSFPFNTTQTAAQCTSGSGSICAVAKGFQIPCHTGIVCRIKGIQIIRFCGGVQEFRKAQLAVGVEGSGSTIDIHFITLIISVIALIDIITKL